jgi:AhpD family alkylhydroperoxidase
MDEVKKYAELNRSFLRGLNAIGRENSELTRSFHTLHQSTMKAGALNVATKELMALCCAIVTGCESCIAMHTDAALRAGASREAFQETLSVAVLMGGGPALTYATKAMQAYEEFAK